MISQKPYFNAIGFLSDDPACYSHLTPSLLTHSSQQTELSGSDVHYDLFLLKAFTLQIACGPLWFDLFSLPAYLIISVETLLSPKHLG